MGRDFGKTVCLEIKTGGRVVVLAALSSHKGKGIRKIGGVTYGYIPAVGLLGWQLPGGVVGLWHVISYYVAVGL